MIGSHTVACIRRVLVVVAVPILARAQQAPPSSGSPALVAASPGAAGWTWVPAKGSATAAMRQTIALDLRAAPFHTALQIIGQRAGLSILYGPDVAAVRIPISLRVDNMTVGEALDRVLEGTGLEAYVSLHGTAVLVRRENTPLPRATQVGGMITGRVTDAVTHAFLDQVAVRVEGPGLGAVTTSDGRYTIRNIPPGTYRATARRVGYTPLTKSLHVATDSATNTDFVLTAAPTRLNEMVTTAIGDQRRYEVGNVISTINADSIAPTAPITSLTDLISARAPGVTVEETGGLTGSGEAIRIRGQSSLVLQGDPIVIVDGVRQNPAPGGTAAPLVGFGSATAVPSPSRLNDLDFADVQSIDVLKGPAASTEYGTDAANGVIVIATKHGTAGRPQWAASVEETASQVPVRFPTLYYSWGHTTDANHTQVNCPLVPYVLGSGVGSATGTCAVDSVTTWDPLNQPYYSIFGTGGRQKYGLSVSGGTDAVRYYVAGGLSNEIGVLRMPGAFVPQAQALGLPHSVFRPNGENQRSVRTNTAMHLGPTMDLTVNGSYLSTYQKTPNAQSLFAGVTYSPALRDSVNGYGYSSTPFNTPVYQLGMPASQATDRLTGGLTATWRPAWWLVGHGTVGVDHGSERDRAAILPQVAPLFTYYPAQLGLQNVTTDIYTVDLRTSATAAFTRTLRALASVGVQLADTRAQGTTAIAKGITATNFTLNGAVSPAVAELGNRQATLGGYGEEQLGVANRLFLTAAFRIDAGSGFGHAYSTAVYPKASLSWLVLDARQMTMRLRGAFGESGVQPPNGSALQLYAPSAVWLNGGPRSVVQIANVQNQRLQPERSEEYESGLDIGLWQNRVSLDLTGYSKMTHNALVSTGTGWDAGGFSYEENVGEVRNAGVEGGVTATVIQTPALTWDLNVNASVNQSRLVALAPGILSQQLFAAGATYRFAPGRPLYGYWAPRVQYADLNHDGVLEPNEVTIADSLTYVGPSLPTREVSLGTHVGLWDGAVSVSALVDYRGGFRLASTAVSNEALVQSDPASNQRRAPLWQQARDVAIQAINVNGLDGYANPASVYEDATYVRFRELSLTYTLPRRVVHTLRAQRVSVTGAVRNLTLWTRYGGLDPEAINTLGQSAQLSATSNTSVVNNDLRVDAGAVPLLRYWVIRFNAGW